jgi:hypothetical protein
MAMIVRSVLASALAVSTLVGAALPSRAEPARSLAVSGVAAIYPSVSIPFAGVELAYDVNSRLSLDAQLTSVILAHDLAAGARLFFARYPSGRLYLGANAHYIATFTSFHSDRVLTVSAEAGAENRSESRVVFGLSLGYMRRVPFESPILREGDSDVGGLGVLVRLGKAF